MQDKEANTLVAVQRNELASYSKVIKKTDLEYYIWVRLDPEFTSNCFCYQVDEVNNPKVCRHLTDAFMRENTTWMKIKTDLINTSVGYHCYRLHFVDKTTDYTFSLYIAYTIQDDNPDKPYIYMEREDDV